MLKKLEARIYLWDTLSQGVEEEKWEAIVEKLRTDENDFMFELCPSDFEEILSQQNQHADRTISFNSKIKFILPSLFDDPHELATEVVVDNRMDMRELDAVRKSIQEGLLSFVKTEISKKREYLTKLFSKTLTVQNILSHCDTISDGVVVEDTTATTSAVIASPVLHMRVPKMLQEKIMEARIKLEKLEQSIMKVDDPPLTSQEEMHKSMARRAAMRKLFNGDDDQTAAGVESFADPKIASFGTVGSEWTAPPKARDFLDDDGQFLVDVELWNEEKSRLDDEIAEMERKISIKTRLLKRHQNGRVPTMSR